ncbi:MAG: peptide deformylase [bacterium]|nr:peptide deformylase [bacterium]
MAIKTYGDPCLRKKNEDIKEVTPEVLKLVNDMLETMYANKGVGLAAPQVGVNKNLVVVDVGDVSGKHELVVLINPEFLSKEGAEVMEEACLSCPRAAVRIRRAKKTVVQAINQKGEKIIREDTGFLSRAIQHEMDHLKGKLIIDSAGFFEKIKLISKMKKKKTGQ